jgi:hypothetical protein
MTDSRICPKCGGKKNHYARTCQKCAPPRLGHKGLKGQNHPAWKGGTMLDRDGYLKRYMPEHPWPRKGGYVREHVRIMELHINRQIMPTEIVHHKDHDITNNALENLELLTKSEHSRYHRALDKHHQVRDLLGRYATGGMRGAPCPNG